MSQAKVDRYKEEKRNREKTIKKEKRHNTLLKIGGTVVALVLIGWIGVSSYLKVTDKTAGTGSTYDVNTTSLDDYLNTMAVAQAEETEAVADADTETEEVAETVSEEVVTDAETE